MSIYSDMAAEFADEMREHLAQGGASEVRYIHPAPTTGPDWNPTPDGDPTPHDLLATVSGVSAEYLNDSNISVSDLVVKSVPVAGVTPSLEGLVEIDGREHQVIGFYPVPKAGPPVSWHFVVKA